MYLIKRGPRPAYHRAPFHPVIICNKRRIAKWEAGCTGDRAWVWSRGSNRIDGEGFLLERWNGLDIDYGHVVHDVGAMPDGTPCCFVHPHKVNEEPWTLIKGAVWWDDKKIPPDFLAGGVIYPPDFFTQQKILDSIAEDGCTGFGNRAAPYFWPKRYLVS